MLFNNLQTFLPLTILFAVTLSTSNAFAGDAVYTSDITGTAVNQNIYATSADVYLSGGPQNKNAAGLADGTYYFQVTDPSGGALLSTDNAVCRQLLVSGGRVQGAVLPRPVGCPTHGGMADPADGTFTVQMFPFSGTPNNGGEYKVWVVPVGSATIGADHMTLSFSNSDSKTDNFNVQLALTPPPPPAISSCRPTNSLTVLVQGASVTSYVPNGAWDSTRTGVQVVPIEPAGTPTPIATPGVVNTCASNWITGETVCTANNNDVYLITGTSLNKTLTSGANSFASFSGGACKNCGVGINAVTNTAAIAMGVSPSPSGSGIQFLNLNANTFSAPVPAASEVSEDILWDPGRNLILSPNERGNYDLFNTATMPPQEYAHVVGGTLDSAGEDCTTGIALAADEFTSKLVLTDLTQATFTAGAWTAPTTFVNLPEFNPYDFSEAGTSGVAVAPGSHLGIVTGEFPEPPSGGNAIIAIQLPSTSGIGTPSLVDYAVATLPNDPDGNPFSTGCDPHTTTSYVSPNTGKAIGLVTDYGTTACYFGGKPAYIGVIDLQGMLSAPRIAGTHTAISPLPAGVVTFVKAQ